MAGLQERPNLVLFMPDQLRADAVGAFGNTVVQTPNIDALAARGVAFVDAYAQHSVCSPSRASILTGWYPHTAGHRTLTHLLKPWEPNLLRLLRDGGYNVAWAGHRGDTFAPGVTEESTDFSGFLVRPDLTPPPSPFPQDHPMWQAFYVGRREPVVDFDEATVQTAEAWLAGRPCEPWALLCALGFPHPPFTVEEPWFSMHARSAVPAPLPPAGPGDKPRFHRQIRQAYGTDRLSAEDWAEIIATYYGMVARVDDQLGRVLRAVEAVGAQDRTATFFFTDHGEYLGDFGLVEKWPSGLEPCLTRNPLIVAVPGGAEGATCPALVELVDLLPTMLDLAGAKVSHSHFGHSLVGLLEQPSRAHRDAAFSEGGFSTRDEDRFERGGGHYLKKGRLQHDDPESAGKATAIRTDRWTYVHRLYERDELYDRAADPFETTNLIDQPDHADVASSLRNRMLDWLVDTADVFPWAEDPRAPRIPHGYRREAASD